MEKKTKTKAKSKSTKQKTTPKQPKTNIMEALLKKRGLPKIKIGDLIDAKIIKLEKRRVVFDIGGKAKAILGNKEIKEITTYLPYLKEGQKIKVRVIADESREGFPVVSMRNFFEEGKWKILEDKKENEEEIEVICGKFGKGGVFVEFMGIRGVIPKIQLIEEYIKNADKLQGQKIKVKVLEVDRDKNRLVVSQKAAVFKTSQKELLKHFKEIKKGEKYKAKVLNISNFGIFCEVNKVEGLVHISEISWEKVVDISRHAKIGDVIDVVVTEKNDKDLKLNLSIKRLQSDPWSDIEKRYPKNKEFEGTIVRKADYGYFVNLAPGIEGLIHISKLTGNENFKIGQKVKVYIEKINKRVRRISLLLPQKAKPVMYR